MVGNSLSGLVRRVLAVQSISVVVGAVGLILISGWASAVAVIAGGGVGMVLTWITARSIRRSSDVVLKQPAVAMWPLYSGLLQKIFIALGGMMLATIVFKLSPIFVILGFVLTQLGYLTVLYGSEI